MKIQTKTILIIILIFFSGITIGTGGTLMAEKIIIRRTLENPERARMHILNRISKRHHLSSEQTMAVQNILEEQAREFRSIRTKAAPDIEKVFENSHEKIVDILDESQRKKFEIYHRIMMNKFRKIFYSGMEFSGDQNGNQDSDNIESKSGS